MKRKRHIGRRWAVRYATSISRAVAYLNRSICTTCKLLLCAASYGLSSPSTSARNRKGSSSRTASIHSRDATTTTSSTTISRYHLSRPSPLQPTRRPNRDPILRSGTRKSPGRGGRRRPERVSCSDRRATLSTPRTERLRGASHVQVRLV